MTIGLTSLNNHNYTKSQHQHLSIFTHLSKLPCKTDLISIISTLAPVPGFFEARSSPDPSEIQTWRQDEAPRPALAGLGGLGGLPGLWPDRQVAEKLKLL